MIHCSNAAPLTGRDVLKQKLQGILDKHGNFWNASFSFGMHNATIDLAVASGKNDHRANTKLTTENRIPMGSTTKMYTAVSVLALDQKGILNLDEVLALYVIRNLDCIYHCRQSHHMWTNTSRPQCPVTKPHRSAKRNVRLVLTATPSQTSSVSSVQRRKRQSAPTASGTSIASQGTRRAVRLPFLRSSR